MTSRLVTRLVILVSLLPSTALAQGTLVAARPDGGIASLRLVDEVVEVTIDQQHATTTLRQIHVNETGVQVEGRYRLRAGEGARVEGFAYWNGEQKIVGEVFEVENLEELDAAERVHDDPPLYRRVSVEALGAPAWIYVYARPLTDSFPIESGDWLKRY